MRDFFSFFSLRSAFLTEAWNYGCTFFQEPSLNKNSNAKTVELVWLWIWKTFYLLLTKLLKTKANVSKWTLCGMLMLHWKFRSWKWDCTVPGPVQWISGSEFCSFLHFYNCVEILISCGFHLVSLNCCRQQAGWEEEWFTLSCGQVMLEIMQEMQFCICN